MPRMTEAERYAAIKQVETWIAQGKSKKLIKMLIAEKFDLQSSAAQNKLYAEALRETHKDFNPEDIRNHIMNRLDIISDKAEETNKFGDAIKALEHIGKLNGLYVDKQEVKLDTKIKVKFGSK